MAARVFEYGARVLTLASIAKKNSDHQLVGCEGYQRATTKVVAPYRLQAMERGF